MENFLIKRRRFNTSLEKITCDICYNDFSVNNIVLCFHNCTIKTCNDCLMKQLKIEKTRRVHNTVTKEIYSIYYTCSMCQQKSYYCKGATDRNQHYKFTNWIKNSPDVMINLIENFINPVTPLTEPPTARSGFSTSLDADRLNGDEEFEQYDLFLSTAFYINDITTPSPSTLPFPYRLLTPPLLASTTIMSTTSTSQPLNTTSESPENTIRSLLSRATSDAIEARGQSEIGSGSPTVSLDNNSDDGTS